MKKHVQVFKFGGASVKNAEGLQNVAKILKTYADQTLVVVVSAMGKTTNALEDIVAAHAAGDGRSFSLLENQKQAHYQIMEQLFDKNHEVFALVNGHFVEIERMLDKPAHPNYDYMYDQIIGVGELVSSRILAAFLEQSGLPVHWLDARGVILTDDIYREGWVQWEETEERVRAQATPLLDQGGFVITQGFIGSTLDNQTTTLGREGSDYTAAIFSFCLDAESMTIWKDVPGVLTADPRLFDNVVKLDMLSYREAIEMTYYGAKVIHPKTIKPLQNKNIPLYVKSFINPEGSGTCISDEAEDNYPPMVAIEQGQALLHISTRDFSFVAEHHMSMLFQKIADLRLQVNMMQNTAISFSICVNDTDGKADRFAAMIEKDFKVRIERNLELISVRHYQEEVLDTMRKGRIVLLEERIRNTVQMVVRNVSMLKPKA